MAKVQNGRFTADVSALGDEVVVFLIGMRINRPWKVRQWWPVFVAMPRMLRYLVQHPEKGLLGFEAAFLPSPIIVQYWRAFQEPSPVAPDPPHPPPQPWPPVQL